MASPATVARTSRFFNRWYGRVFSRNPYPLYRFLRKRFPVLRTPIGFWMLTRYSASQLSAFTFLTPLFGVGFGAAVLNESLSRGFLLGAALILAGITLVNVSDLSWATRLRFSANGKRATQ